MLASAAKLVASQVEVSHSAGALQKRPELFNTYLVYALASLLFIVGTLLWKRRAGKILTKTLKVTEKGGARPTSAPFCFL